MSEAERVTCRMFGRARIAKPITREEMVVFRYQLVAAMIADNQSLAPKPANA